MVIVFAAPEREIATADGSATIAASPSPIGGVVHVVAQALKVTKPGAHVILAARRCLAGGEGREFETLALSDL